MISGVMFYSRQVNRVVLTAYWAFVDCDESGGCNPDLRPSIAQVRVPIEPWRDDYWDDETGYNDGGKDRGTHHHKVSNRVYPPVAPSYGDASILRQRLLPKEKEWGWQLSS